MPGKKIVEAGRGVDGGADRGIERWLFLAVAAFALLFFSYNSVDPDLWGHLKFGETILANHAIPRVDTYSYAAEGQPWINHEWLAEAIFAAIFRFTGTAGLQLFKILLGLTIAFLLWRGFARAVKSVTGRLLILLFFAEIEFGFATRPQLFTYLFAALLAVLLLRYDETKARRYLLGLPVLFGLWANLHGGVAFGVGILGLFTLIRTAERKASWALWGAALAALAATLLNPYGAGLWKFLYMAVTLPRPFMDEWGRVAFSFARTNFFCIALLGAAALIVSRCRFDRFKLVVLAAAFIAAFLHQRHTVLFAILAGLYLPRPIEAAFGDWFRRSEAHVRRSLLKGLLILLAVAALAAIPVLRANPFTIMIDAGRYPMDAIEVMKTNGVEGNILAFFDWAELVLYEGSPRWRVFVDGRYETVYNTRFVDDTFGLLMVRFDPVGYLAQFRETDAALLPDFLPLTKFLKERSDWAAVYTSPAGATLLLKRNVRNRVLLEAFAAGTWRRPQGRPPYYF